ncbi:branched-chain amino acid transport system substrate-binding protein [Clostridiales Family XIII bacterium PM5-7]
MNIKKNVVLVLTLVVAIVAMSGCTTFNNFKDTFFAKKGTEADTIKIGVLEPETGTDSRKGQLEIDGIKMAHSLVGEVLGKKVELVYADTQSSIYVAETVVQDLITKKPAIVLGSCGEAVTMVAGKYLGEAKIPAITITAENPLITKNNPYYFRVCFNEASQAKAISEYVSEKLLSDTAAVVRMKNDDAVAPLVSQFTDTFTKKTKDANSISTRLTIDPNEKDYAAYVKLLASTETRAVFMPISLKYAEKFFAEVSKQNYFQPTFIGPKEWHSDELIKLQEKFPGIRIAVASDFNINMEDNIRVAEETAYYDMFVKAYESKYGKMEPEEETAQAFDAYMLAIEAIEQAQSTDSELITEALKATKGFAGASGNISFDESGESMKTINIDVIRDGKFVSIYTIN